MSDVEREEARPGRVYPWYVLAVLVLVYVLNFIDRQIVVILAERIKADLHVTDAQLGFLYGTVFAVFFAVFAIPLGRLADAWDRRRLIAWGTAFWSLMTALSGLARGFGPLALARLGVGAGEASAAPAAYSLLSDWFPRERRGAVLGIFSSGIFIGAGLGLGIGGFIVDRWDAAFPAGTAPLDLHGWQAAFLVVGLPGLALALWVRTLREPPRGGFGAPPVALHPRPFRLFLGEMAAVIPPFTLVTLARAGAGSAGLAFNVGAAALLAAAAWSLTRVLGTAVQWIALAAGLYAVFSWAQGLRLKSRADFDLVFCNPPLVLSNIGIGLVTFGTYSTSLWIAPFFLRVHHLDIAKVGLLLGGMLAAGGWLGATLGGILADAWHRKNPRGRVYVSVLTAALALPLGFIFLNLRSSTAALLLSFPVAILTGLWIGPAASTVQELVPPRLRATASAVYILHTTFLGLALGPYAVGRLSIFTGDLKSAMLLALPVQGLAAVLLFLAARRIPGRDTFSS
ncbi:MAG: MFS transporter [Acidobacteriota bacterium]|nr:MFS transporter [Acidobacteriota bacterium]